MPWTPRTGTCLIHPSKASGWFLEDRKQHSISLLQLSQSDVSRLYFGMPISSAISPRELLVTCFVLRGLSILLDMGARPGPS